MKGRGWGAMTALVVICGIWMAWPLPLELGTAWTSARAEGDLGWSLFLHRWTTDALMGAGFWTGDPRVWSPEGGALPTSAWNLVALVSTAWLGVGATALEAWHRSMFLIGLLNGLAGAWLGYRVGGRPGAAVAAVACACAPLAWFEMAEGRLEQGLIAPIAVWMAEAWALFRSPRAGLAGLALGLVAATYWFLGPVALLVALPLMLIVPHPHRSSLGLDDLLPGILAFGAIVAIALLPVGGAAWRGAQSAALVDPVLGQTQRLASSVSPLSLVVGGHLPAHRIPVVALLWTPLAWRNPHLRPWLVSVGLAALLAAGPVLTVHQQPLQLGGFELSLPLRLLDILPGFSRFWWPDRIVAVAGVVAAGGLAIAVSAQRHPWRWVTIAIVLLAVDGRVQLRSAISSGDPRIPTSPLDPAPSGGFFARPTVPDSPGDTTAIIGPWAKTANTIPLVALASGRPLMRGDGAADRRLWPTSFAASVSSDPLLTALANGTRPPSDVLPRLHAHGVDAVLWLGTDGRSDWSEALGCAPAVVEPWALWDRNREDCR